MSEQPPTYPSGMPSPAQGGSGMAIAALVVGIVGLVLVFCFWPLALVCGIVAIVLGVIARGKANRGEAGGGGKATAGLVCGIIAVLLGLCMLVFVGLFAKTFVTEMQKQIEQQQRMNQSAPAEPVEEVAPQSWLDTPQTDRAA